MEKEERVLRGFWARSIMHLLAGVVPLSHRRAIAPTRRYSSCWSHFGSREKVCFLCIGIRLARINAVWTCKIIRGIITRNIN